MPLMRKLGPFLRPYLFSRIFITFLRFGNKKLMLPDFFPTRNYFHTTASALLTHRAPLLHNAGPLGNFFESRYS